MLQRLITALILVTIVGVAMFAFESHYPFLLLLIVGMSIGAKEWRKLVPQNKAKPFSVADAILFFVPILGAIATFFPHLWVGIWVVGTLLWLVAIKWILTFPEKITWFDNRIAITGMIFMVSTLTAMYHLWLASPWWLMYVFVLVWSADTGAYFAGRKFGKKKMAPKVSPNKSMEGLYGGLALGLLMVVLVSVFKLHYTGMQLLYFVVLSGITIVASVFGDLFESMLKRQAGVKDSGTILPGHGGVLDRIDSLLSATPLFALGFWVMQRVFG